MELNEFRKKTEKQKKENKVFYQKLEKNTPKNLDVLFHDAHEEAFEKIDCLTCANCCKTTSPIFYQKDIERVAGDLVAEGIDLMRTGKVKIAAGYDGEYGTIHIFSDEERKARQDKTQLTLF